MTCILRNKQRCCFENRNQSSTCVLSTFFLKKQLIKKTRLNRVVLTKIKSHFSVFGNEFKKLRLQQPQCLSLPCLLKR